MRLRTIAITALLLGGTPAPATAAPGALDTTFGAPNGFTLQEFGAVEAGVLDVVVEPETGKLVATVAIGEAPEFGIARFLPGGALDPSFNPTGTPPGINREDFGTIIPEQPLAVTRAPDGKFVVAGISKGFGDRIHIARYTADGTLDPSFDDGWTNQVVPGATAIDRVADVHAGADGKVTVAATATFPDDGTPSGNAIVVVRWLANGTLDPSFDETPTVAPAGMVLVEGDGDDENGNGMLVDPQGRTVVVGATTKENEIGRIFATRLTPTGARDSTFSGDGVHAFGVAAPSVPDLASDVIRQPDGRLVLAAQIDPLLTPASFGVVGLTDAGALDTTFGTNGFTVTPVGEAGELGLGGRMAAEPGGQIVVAGNLSKPVPNDEFIATLVRYEADGKLDTSYGTQGVAKPSPFAAPNPLITTVDVDPLGRAVVGGLVQSTPTDGLIARLLGDPPPANTATPELTGSATVGGTLTCSPGTWSGAVPQTYTFEWLRAGTAIAGATSATYATVADDVGKTLACRVTATSFAGKGTAESAGLQIATAATPTPTPTPAPTPNVVAPKLKLTVTGKARHRIGTLAVTVLASENATLRVTTAVKRARAKPSKRSLVARKAVKVKIRFAKKALRKLTRQLKMGAKLKATITARATNASGKSVVARKTVKLRR